MTALAYTSRDDVPEKYRWDLSGIFADEETFLTALGRAGSWPRELAAFAGTVSSSSERLLGFLELDAEVEAELNKLVTYAHRRLDEDTRISRYQDLSARVLALATEVEGAKAWFDPELLGIPEERMERFYSHTPGLSLYRRALDQIFQHRAHTLSAPEELILTRAGEVAAAPGQIFSLFNDADLVFEDARDAGDVAHRVTHGSYIPLLMSPDRTLRESAFKSVYSTYGRFRNTCAATLGAQAKQLKFYADCRSYPTTLDYALDRTEVPTAVYRALVEAVHGHMKPMYRYVDLRRRAIGLDELHFWDLYVPIVPNLEMEFTYDEACRLMLEALTPLGEGYLRIVREGLSQRWVDVCETPGKRSGAYSAGGYGMHPVILMNFQGRLDDAFTLIHEMGHSVHTYLSCKNQPSIYSDYVIFVAEVASTVNEVLLTRYLLRTLTDPAQRAYVLNHFLEQFRGTLYRQTMFAEFELKVCRTVERGEGVTADALCDTYRDLVTCYFGDGIVLDEEIGLEWARIPHFYYEYYVYQYATSFAAAVHLAQRILDGEPGAVADYLDFLSGGSSRPPLELLRGAGVDMASAKPIVDAIKQFDTLVDELADMLGR